MKKLIMVLLFSSLFIFAANQTMEVMVEVESIFELNLDRITIDLQRMKPGEVKQDIPDNEGVKVTVKTNVGRPWYIKINNLQELSSSSTSIPNSFFYWYGYPGKNATGLWYGKGDDTFSLDPVLAYSSSADEYNNYPIGTDVYFKFKVKIPPKQQAGLYRSTVVVTLTE